MGNGETFPTETPAQEVESDVQVDIQAGIDETKADIQKDIDASIPVATEGSQIDDIPKAQFVAEAASEIEMKVVEARQAALAQAPHIGENVDETSTLRMTEPVVIAEFNADQAKQLRQIADDVEKEVAEVYDRVEASKPAFDESKLEPNIDKAHDMAIAGNDKEADAVRLRKDALEQASKIGENVDVTSDVGETNAAIHASVASFRAESASRAAAILEDEAASKYERMNHPVNIAAAEQAALQSPEELPKVS